MWAHRVVVVLQSFNDHSSLLSGSKPLQSQTLLAQFAIEAFIGAVLPGLSRVAQGGWYSTAGNPLEDDLAHKFGPVDRSHEQRSNVDAHQPREHCHHAAKTDEAGYGDCQALTRVLVDDGQALDLLAFCFGVEDKVVRPHRVGLEVRVGQRSNTDNAPARSLPGKQQASLAPDAVGGRPAQLQASEAQGDKDAPVAVTRLPGRPCVDRSDDWSVLGWQTQCAAQTVTS